jgi:hypothetical protein
MTILVDFFSKVHLLLKIQNKNTNKMLKVDYKLSYKNEILSFKFVTQALHV